MTAVEILNKHLLGKTSITQDTEGFVLAVVNAMEEYAQLAREDERKRLFTEEEYKALDLLLRGLKTVRERHEVAYNNTDLFACLNTLRKYVYPNIAVLENHLTTKNKQG